MLLMAIEFELVSLHPKPYKPQFQTLKPEKTPILKPSPVYSLKTLQREAGWCPFWNAFGMF